MKPALFALLAGAILAAGLTACGENAPTPPGTATGGGVDTSEPAPPPQASPIALRIPSIGLDTRQWQVVGFAPDGTMEVPPVTQPEVVGWYCPLWKDTSGVDCGAPVPGEAGPAVVLAHISGGGKRGAFADLAKVKSGALVEIDRSDGYTATFRVNQTLVVDKAHFPGNRVYGDTPTAQLRLITCGPNKLDRKNHSYLDQTIVFAELATLRPSELRSIR